MRLLARMRSEYRALPGMRLTLDQAARLWAIDRDTCWEALDCLVDEGFLERDQFGRFKKHACH